VCRVYYFEFLLASGSMSFKVIVRAVVARDKLQPARARLHLKVKRDRGVERLFLVGEPAEPALCYVDTCLFVELREERKVVRDQLVWHEALCYGLLCGHCSYFRIAVLEQTQRCALYFFKARHVIQFCRVAKHLYFCLVKLAQPQKRLPRRYLVAKALANLRYPKRQPAAHRLEHPAEIDKYRLARLRAQIRLFCRRSDADSKHHVEPADVTQLALAVLAFQPVLFYQGINVLV